MFLVRISIYLCTWEDEELKERHYFISEDSVSAFTILVGISAILTKVSL